MKVYNCRSLQIFPTAFYLLPNMSTYSTEATAPSVMCTYAVDKSKPFSFNFMCSVSGLIFVMFPFHLTCFRRDTESL